MFAKLTSSCPVQGLNLLFQLSSKIERTDSFRLSAAPPSSDGMAGRPASPGSKAGASDRHRAANLTHEGESLPEILWLFSKVKHLISRSLPKNRCKNTSRETGINLSYKLWHLSLREVAVRSSGLSLAHLL